MTTEKKLIISLKPDFFKDNSSLLERALDIITSKDLSLSIFFFQEHREEECLKKLPQQNVTVGFITDNEEKEADFVLILGGDGSILWTLKRLHPVNRRKRILAINLGTIGFICQFVLKSFETALEQFRKLLRGEKDHFFQILTTYSLVGQVLNKDKVKTGELRAFNEIIWERQDLYLVKTDIFLNGKHLVKLNSDGVIISTQLGSTAYCYSAQGGFMAPGSKSLQVTPLHPFAMNFRNLVVSDQTEITLKQSYEPGREQRIRVVADSNNLIELDKDDEVKIFLDKLNPI